MITKLRGILLILAILLMLLWMLLTAAVVKAITGATMHTTKATLKTGLTIGESTHTDAVIREATAADLIEATEESEKLVATEKGYELVASPTLVGLNTLRRQIVSIGEHKGPLAMAELKKLSAADLSLLQEKALELESAALKGATDRGRD